MKNRIALQASAIFLILLCACAFSAAAGNPKREFRGAWLHTVFQDQYHRQSTEQNQAYLRAQLDRLSEAGVNAVIFQVRPQADAFYVSELEPWSRFLTDDGAAPEPLWDPLQFMIDESHRRGMELHAWINPYRVTSSKAQIPAPGHLYHRYPERFVRFDDKIYFDPALAENREHIVAVVSDIVERYDVDGIHFDDYFYPYPVKGKEFPDAESYARFGGDMELADWRRSNVDLLIEAVHETIATTKPWVVFGVSPFGIWRNKSTDERGSDTGGLENYDGLYADVLLWAKNGWVDYLVPQLYWDLNHRTASYITLVDWWNRNSEGRNMYIGQSIPVTMAKPSTDGSGELSQLRQKIGMTREARNIRGNCWWPGYDLAANKSGIADSLLIEYQATVALPPTYSWISSERPSAPEKVEYTAGKLRWTAPKTSMSPDDAAKFVIYRFDEGDPVDLENSEAIEAIVWDTEFVPEYSGTYLVTALSRVNQESRPSRQILISIDE